jgi:hypothetical protein
VRVQVIKSMLQLASIAVSQKLYDESEEHLRGVLSKVGGEGGGGGCLRCVQRGVGLCQRAEVAY